MSLLSTNTANDIWSSGAFSFESPLKDLLDSGNYTLELLLREDELLQEVKGMHPILISYLGRVDSCRQLLNFLVSSSPSSDSPDNGSSSEDDPEEVELRTIKYPYMACEVICCEIAGILDTIVDHVEGEDDDDDDCEKETSTTAAADDNGEHQQQGGDGDTTAAALAAANDAAAAVEVSSVASCDGSGVVVDEGDDTGGRRCLLDLFFGILERETLDDRLAGYFEKILTILFQHRPATLQSYISSRGLPLLKLFFHHLSSHSITQILLRLLLPSHPSPFPYPPTSTSADTYSHPTIQSCFAANPNEYTCLLLDELKSLRGSIDVNRNAAEILILAIRNDESHHVVEGLLRHDFLALLGSVCRGVLRQSKEEFVNHESRLTCFLSVFEVILRCFFGKDEHHHASSLFLLRGSDMGWGDEMTCGHIHGDSEEEQDFDDKLETILPLFASLLTHTSTKSWNMVNQTGTTQPILGYSRLCIVKCLNALVLLDNPDIDALLIKHGLFKILLDLFFEFEWSSVLHTHVSSVVTNVLNGGPMRYDTQAHLIVDCKMLDMIMSGFQKESDFRLGYIGHLIVISQAMQNILRKDAASEDDDVDVVNVVDGVAISIDEEMMQSAIEEVDIEQRRGQMGIVLEKFPDASSPQVIQGHFTSRDVDIDIYDYQDDDDDDEEEEDPNPNPNPEKKDDEEADSNQTSNNSDGQESHDDPIQTTTAEDEDATPKLDTDTPPTDETPMITNDNLSEQESTEQPLSPPSPPPPPASPTTETDDDQPATPTPNDPTTAVSKPSHLPTENHEIPPPPSTNFHPPTTSCDTTLASPTLPQLVHSHTPLWISFYTTTLHPIVQIQSTPLGNTLPPHPHEELSMTETDYDVAASMIDSLANATESLPFGSKIDYHPEGNSHDFIYGEDDDDDDDVPVIDLFAGNFDSKPRTTKDTTTVESIVDRVEREAKEVLECEDDDSDEEEEEEEEGEEEEDEVESPEHDEGPVPPSSSSPPPMTTARWATFEGEDLFDTPAGQCFEAEFPSFDDDTSSGGVMNGEISGEAMTEGGSKDKVEEDPFGDVGRRLKIDELF